MDIRIRAIDRKHYNSAYCLQYEYLDRVSYAVFIKRIEAISTRYLGAFHHDELIGICYGQPSSRNVKTFQLQGIAVRLDGQYARKGIGSRLLQSFEKIVKNNGYTFIDLGSADDMKVEQFYLKNAYQPFELVAKDHMYQDIARIAISNYEEGKVIKKELYKQYKPKEVIYIFRKPL